MANSDDFRTFVKDRLLALDPTLDVSEGSRAMREVVEPIATKYGADPLAMDVTSFIHDRVNQEYPSLPTEEGSGVSDTLIKPNIPIVSAYDRSAVQMGYNQSFVNLSLMSNDAVDDLLANHFLSRIVGGYSVGSVRVFFAAPTYSSFTGVTQFTSSTGKVFLPTTTQTITAEQMVTNRQGLYYYVDVVVRAQETGDGYDVEPGEINSVTGVDGAVRVTNLFKMEGGLSTETNEQAAARGKLSLSERSLTMGRGIFTRLFELYGSNLRNLVVTGMGDPEMQRDILTGRGEGRLISSGFSLVVGNWMIHVGMYEDRGDLGSDGIQAGQEVDLNYWGTLYGLPSYQQHETFEIEAVIGDTRNLIPSMPSITLMQISGTPTPTGTVLSGGVQDVLPMVFSAIREPGNLEISDVPGGILRPTTINGTIEINADEVHIGGKHDVWVRPVSDSRRSLTIDELWDEEPVVTGSTLNTYGVTGPKTNLVDSSDATVDWRALGVEVGHLLVITTGSDAAVYVILRVESDNLYLDADLTADASNLVFKVVDDVQHNLISPKKVSIPYGPGAPGDDLQTTIGSAIVTLGTNILPYGADVGHVLEILDGPDAGTYTITDFDITGGGTTPVLDRAMGASTSNLNYMVYVPQEGIQRPFVRIIPEGVRLLDSSDQATDVTIPPSLPVDARSVNGFTGARPVADGGWGFVLPDPGAAFRPLGDRTCDVATYLETQINPGGPVDLDVVAWLGDITASGCYSDSCLPCNGWIGCIKLTTHNFRIGFLPSADHQTYVNQLVTWFGQVWQAFFNTAATIFPDIDADGITWSFPGALVGGTERPLWQSEICIPKELFDCCTNVWLGLPEFEVARLAQIVRDTLGSSGLENLEDLFLQPTIAEVVELLTSSSDPAILQASPGDALTVASGPNQGGYIIREVHEYRLLMPIYNMPSGLVADTSPWVDTLPLLRLGIAIIEGEFPVDTCGNLCDFFQEGFPSAPNLPVVPVFPGDCYDPFPAATDPYQWIVKFFQFILDWLGTQGMDIPTNLDVDWGDFITSLLEVAFPQYEVGNSTCQNRIRVYWSEPTTAEFDGGGECVAIDQAVGDPVVVRAGVPSMFSTTVGSTQLMFAASMDVDPYMVLPPKETVADIDRLDWPRDIEFTYPGGADPAQASLTDLSLPAPLAIGLQVYKDVMYLHEELFLIVDKTTRPALVTTAGSNIVMLQATMGHQVITDDIINVGDLVFIEEGLDADGYVVTKLLTETAFELDRPMVESTETLISAGDQGDYDGAGANPARLTYTGGVPPFTSDDIGRYLTVYGTPDQDDDASRQIVSVDAAGFYVEVSVSFAGTETGMFWAVTPAPATAPAATVSGGTELVGLRPFRIYNGTATEWMVVAVDDGLDNSTALFDVQLHSEVIAGDAPTVMPTDGIQQPFSLVRPGIQRITSTQMAENRENGLYYFDVWARSLGSNDVFNVAAGERFEPVLGTYQADGYHFDVENNNFTFSSYEEVTLVLSPKILPVGATDELANFLPTRGQKIQIVYEFASLVNQIQQLMLSNTERQLDADPLVRHFLPQYLYLVMRYTGSTDAATLVTAFSDYIKALNPRDEVSLARLERMLEQNGVTDWTHPTELITLTHDLDRRMVVERSVDRVGGVNTVVHYNGTNRTSFLIPGPDRSDLEEDEIPAGEMFYLERVTAINSLE